MKAIGERAASITSFRSLWKQLCPEIMVAKPRSDLCWMCQKNNWMIYRCTNVSEEDKSSILKKQEEHLRYAMMERELLNKTTAEAKKAVEGLGLKLHQNRACSRDMTMHYSFDFAQQVHVPSNPFQPGPLFFLTGLKIGLFGVQCEALPQQ
ncbi:uncharacterized protein LOC117116394, partial [Anneissia japonica]|uniref:uncharacterized protein LOC117116394 n=1 Tax=Anneissia japonica TaxID=1529436 RepID=UPI0014255161